MLTDSNIRDALTACFTSAHPYRRPLNIVALGLVESIALHPDREAPGAGIAGVPPRQRLTLALVPCTAEEDANAMLVAQVENRLAGLPELSRSVIQLLDAPRWTTARISPELRAALRLDAPVFPILNNR